MTARKEPANSEKRERHSKPLHSCSLPNNLKIKLSRAGYVTVEDVADFTAAQLSQGMGCTDQEAQLVLEACLSGGSSSTPPSLVPTPDPRSEGGWSGGTGDRGPATDRPGQPQARSLPASVSLKDLLERERELGSIVTFCSKLDDVLGGGIPLGKITELCGMAGSGKTQLCMQVAVDTTIPAEFGGVGGHALYIDTEGSMVVERVAQIARAAVKHVSDVAESMFQENGDEDLRFRASRYTFDEAMASVHCYRTTNHLDLLALMHTLPQVCAANPRVRLVVLDSVACPFRVGFSDIVLRNRVLNGLAQSLVKLAVEKSLAVVLTNHMVNHFPKRGGAGGVSSGPHPPRMVPALGESWGHVCTNRVALSRQRTSRSATLFKSPCMSLRSVAFAVTEFGVRDAEGEEDREPFSPPAEALLVDNEDRHRSKRPHHSEQNV